jgi:FtsH-binding integral membrane protein
MSYQYDEHDSAGEAVDDFNDSTNRFAFTEKSIRLGFIRKVYSILLCQLIVTIGFICLFLYVEPVRAYSHQNVWLWAVAMALTLVCIIALACCPDVRRTFPTNMIFLGIFTLCESFLLGSVASYYKADAVLIAAGITAVVALGLTIFAFQTKWDFTMCSGGLFVFLIILLCFGFLCAIIQNHILNIFYASLGALVFSMYIVFDTQMMMGGKHQYSLSPEEYIFAALNLYLDIINLFLFILSIIGQARNN